MNYEALPPDTQLIPKELAEKSGCLYGIVKEQLREGVTKIIIEDGAEMAGWDLLRDCTQIVSVKIPSSVRVIADGAFDGCTSLEEIDIPGTVEKTGSFPFNNTPWERKHTEDFFIVGDGILLKYQGRDEKVVVPYGVKKIGCFAFMSDSGVTSVTLPETVTEIHTHAFTECNNLTEINIPSSVKIIMTTPTRGCFFKTPWFEDTDKEFLVAGDGILLKYSGSDKKVTVPDNVKRIAMGAFEEASQAEEIFFGSNVEYIEGYAFRQTAWFRDNMDDFVIAGGILIDYRGKSRNPVIPYGVKGIGECAFAQRPVISAEIPDSVKFIGDFAFGECTELESIRIPDSVEYIGTAAFQCCEKLKSVTVPSSVKSIGEVAFGYCESLEDVNIMGGDTRIGMKAFIKQADCVMPHA